ncbi:peptidase M14 [Salegentibacter mishustinae]|uniref:Peptidase M14 n=2 Tax=Salegentibacter mishustinae TaxID=270918 RepID=A0A0Q9ZEY4_9FLAO|nr:peptidase M14 [Salegentibacter mishustinae]PNW21392.1 peptidase M14 [Salegentibacter mishustinae]GGW97425.1 peptidase M14 [Salegentibacter mishustinae]
MEETGFIKALFEDYNSFKNHKISGRYIQQKDIQVLLDNLGEEFSLKEIGTSVLGKPIHSIQFGNGPIKILAWSQMHGNESTTTKAVFDLLNYISIHKQEPLVRSILNNCSLCIIPMLNPDGAEAYTRVNANRIDLNRDAQDLSQPESRILSQVFKNFNPDFCLNLHDQRTIFSAGNNPEPAVLSFLTPSMDKDRQIFPSRIKSMQLIAKIAQDLSELLPGRIGRYDDGFNINCTGDTFQSTKTPTILFEAGHFPGDYKREETRKYVFLALVSVLNSISENNFQQIDYQKYQEIPENEKLFNDIILRDANSENGVVDIAIQYKEIIKDRKLSFFPEIEKIAPKIKKFAHKEIFCENKKIEINDENTLTENVIVNKIVLNGVELPLKCE